MLSSVHKVVFFTVPGEREREGEIDNSQYLSVIYYTLTDHLDFFLVWELKVFILTELVV